MNNLIPKQVRRSDGVITTVHVKPESHKAPRVIPTTSGSWSRPVGGHYVAVNGLPELGDFVRVSVNTNDGEKWIEGSVDAVVPEKSYFEVDGWGYYADEGVTVLRHGARMKLEPGSTLSSPEDYRLAPERTIIRLRGTGDTMIKMSDGWRYVAQFGIPPLSPEAMGVQPSTVIS